MSALERARAFLAAAGNPANDDVIIDADIVQVAPHSEPFGPKARQSIQEWNASDSESSESEQNGVITLDIALGVSDLPLNESRSSNASDDVHIRNVDTSSSVMGAAAAVKHDDELLMQERRTKRSDEGAISTQRDEGGSASSSSSSEGDTDTSAAHDEELLVPIRGVYSSRVSVDALEKSDSKSGSSPGGAEAGASSATLLLGGQLRMPGASAPGRKFLIEET